MKTKNLMTVGLVGTLLAGTAAWAGVKTVYNVGINTSTRVAYGSMGTARGSADANQYIGCAVLGFSSGSSSVTCLAQDASGVSAYCTSSNPAIVTAATSQSGDAYLYFTYDASGACTYLYVSNLSSYAPREP
ncbi:hypothetical protein [Pyxidicoccus sp. MSG2]|uniref:hypothetical protein n=1 Tax=Pyxidicoccus sp. MSG2 TaxID=2996790 RepID=UPI002270CAF3|nr:hypothetical protein [Pyxidicoccus sp. MSG2]MCY1019253.1 hypothetical protein [Pyxidicoccus sp. MSG2]